MRRWAQTHHGLDTLYWLVHLKPGTKSMALFEEVIEHLEGGVWLAEVCHWVGLWDFITKPNFGPLFSLRVENVVSWLCSYCKLPRLPAIIYSLCNRQINFGHCNLNRKMTNIAMYMTELPLSRSCRVPEPELIWTAFKSSFAYIMCVFRMPFFYFSSQYKDVLYMIEHDLQENSAGKSHLWKEKWTAQSKDHSVCDAYHRIRRDHSLFLSNW